MKRPRRNHSAALKAKVALAALRGDKTLAEPLRYNEGSPQYGSSLGEVGEHPMRFKGKVAIVTGSSRGIGMGIALGLAREGARVVISARTEQEQEKLPGTIYATAEEVRAQGGEALPIRCNVAIEKDVEELVAKTLQRWGRIDIVVNNAGIGSYVPFTEVTVKHWDLVTAVNLRGPFLCTRFVLPSMIQQRSGSIVNISSCAAEAIFSITIPKEGAERTVLGAVYGTTKAALERFTRGLAAEVGRHNIAVNAVKPGRPVMSEGVRLTRPDADWSQWASNQSMVKAALFLASQDSRGCTGSVLTDEECILRHGL